MIDNKQIKSVSNRNQINFEINRVVVESYTSTRKNMNKNDNNDNQEKLITINQLINKDNNGNSNENLVNKNKPKIEANNKNEIKETNKEASNNQNSNVIKLSLYSPCSQPNLTIISHIKKFNLPFSINSSSLNYLTTIKKKIEKENSKEKENISINENIENEVKNSFIKNSFIKNLNISSSCIFIGGGQNLKGMRIHLSKSKNDNIVHKEITDFRNSKNKNIEKVEINLSEKNNISNYNKSNEINSLSNLLEAMNKRWKEVEKEYKMRLSYISTNETFIINKKKYIDEIINKINILSTSSSISTSAKNNNKESFILIKQDKRNINKNNPFIYEVICPSSNKELETSINQFIHKNRNKEFNIEAYNKRTSQNIIYLNNDKKRSKFTSNDLSNKSLGDYNDYKNLNNDKETFNPFLIFTYKQLKAILDNSEKKIFKKVEKNHYSINNNVRINYEKPKNIEKPKKLAKNDTDLNFNIFPVKVDKFEFIHTNPIDIGIGGNNILTNINLNSNNNNIDVSNIALNQSDYNYLKQLKPESEYSSQKIKETEDFGQTTPISLLQEKYFLYAVSKWAKFSIINPQSQLVIKYSHKSGHPLFDPIHLDITNFTLWIEKIQSKKDIKKNLINANLNNINNTKNKFNLKSNNSKSKVYKSGATIFLNDSNNNEAINQKNKKKSKSKPKIDKKKNQ